MNSWGFEQVFNVMRYPAGESHVDAKFIPHSDDVIIAPNVRNFEDVANIVVADGILRYNGVAGRWFIPYFPFARHDRRRDLKDGMTLSLAMHMTRDLDLTILDPHSDVTALIRYIPQREVVKQWEKLGIFANDPLVVIPDAGAIKKAYSWLGNRELGQASKYRDPATGKLSGFAVPANVLGRHCVIIDDICDGGGTFLGLAEKIHELGALSITLGVTHGLFTQGMGKLNSTFEQIYTTGLAPPGVRTVKHADLYWGGDRV